MPSYKNDPLANDYDAGDAFDYSVWTANTELTLCNVPWDAVYKDVWWADSTDELNAFIDERGDTTTISNASYARVDEPISIDMPHGRAQRYNYIRVFNPSQPVGNDLPKYYYYFIRGIRHVNPQTTEIAVQLDVWQTYIRQVQLGRAYVDRGHIGIANADNFRNNGRDFLTVPEGMDTGANYVNVVAKRNKVMTLNGTDGFAVLAISTVDLHADHGTRTDPKQPSPRPTGIQGMPSGAAAYIWENATDFMGFMADYSAKPWVTQGISSITLIPSYKRYMAGHLSVKNPTTRSYDASGFIGTAKRRAMFPNWRNSADILNYIPTRYRNLKRFLTAPYCMIEMTVNAGSAIALRPEVWNSRDAAIAEMISIMPPSQRVAFVPLGYNDRNAALNGDSNSINAPYYIGTGDGMDMALFLSAFPTIPIVNNGQIQYLASNARSMAAQYSSMDWSQQRAMQGNQVAFDQATVGMNTSSSLAENAMLGDAAQTQIALELQSQQALMGLLSGTATGAGMGAFAGPAGAIAGGVGGAVSGGVGMMNQGMQADAANRALAQRTATGTAAKNINAGTASYMRDSNKGLADWASKGDYANARSQMDAKVQDTALIPHGVSGQFGGETFNLANDLVEFTLRFKMIDQAAISVLGEYWLRFGYPVRRSMRVPNDLRVMSKFSYWKLTEIYLITAGMPESHKQAIRGILEKGVTVWNDPREIGVIDFASNAPLPGITIEGYEPPPWEPEPDPVDPVKPKRKRKKMLVYATNDGGMKYALAGTSPGTTANFIETDSETRKDSFLAACGVDEPVLLDATTFYEYKSKYLEPVITLETTEGV